MNYKKFALRTLAIVFVLLPHYSFAADVTGGMVALFKFDDSSGTTSLDYVSGIKATFSAQPQWVPGKLSNAASFDGTTVRAVATSAALSNLTALTVSSWIKPTKFGGTDGISNERIVTKSSTQNRRKYGLHVTSDGGIGFYFGFSQSVGSWKTKGGVVRLNEWQQILVTYDASNLSVPPVIYINGVQQQLTEDIKPAGIPYEDDPILYIGDNPNLDGSISTKAFVGAIDQLRFYNRALSASEVTNVYQIENPNNGLLFHWKFEEGSNRVTYDTIGGAIANFINQPTWSVGNIGSGIKFDGVSSRIDAQPTTYGNVNTFTISSWIHLKTIGGSDGKSNSRIVTKTSESGVRRYGFHVAPDGSLGFVAGYTVSQGSWRTAPNLILPNKWYQVSVVYSFDNPTVPPVFYINGVQQSIVTTVLTPSGLPVKESGVLYVGDNPSTDGTVSTRVWNGILDELRIYNRVVFQSELANLYSQENKPNIVVIMTDDQDDMGSMEVLKKVKILLKDKGVTFTNSFVSFPVCCASRASFMTGQYPHNHKIIGNAPAEGGGFLKFALATSPELSTKNSLSVWMQQAGYETTLMGKFLNGYGNQATTDPESAPTYVPPGWDQWMGMPDFYNDGTANFGTYNYFNFAINNNGVIEKYNKGEYQTDTLAKKAVDFITARENSPKPFFIWVTPIAPHYGGNGDDATGGPFPAPRHKGLFSTLPITMNPNFNEADVSDKPDFIKKLPVMNATVIASTSQSFRNRRETLLAVDDMVESIVNALQKTNKLDNTIIIFTSDNGFAQGEHRRSQGKRVLYEESIRVPLVITGPGIPAGETRNQLVNNLDVVATILEVSHAKPGRTIDGKSLVEVFKNKAASWRKALLIEGTDTQVGGTGSTDSRYVAIRTDNYILAYHSTSSSPVIEKEFYDLSKDPYELENKKNDTNYSSVINNLSVSLDALKNCTGSSCFVTNQIVNNSNSPSTLNSIANAISVPFTLFSRGIKSNLNLVASMMGVPPSYALEETTGGWWFKK